MLIDIAGVYFVHSQGSECHDPVRPFLHTSLAKRRRQNWIGNRRLRSCHWNWLKLEQHGTANVLNENQTSSCRVSATKNGTFFPQKMCTVS